VTIRARLFRKLLILKGCLGVTFSANLTTRPNSYCGVVEEQSVGHMGGIDAGDWR
jgi:hypothetical protein